MTLSTRRDRVAPVRDGTCCDGCDIAPPPPCDEAGLVEGGQGRSAAEVAHAARVVQWVVVVAIIIAAVVGFVAGLTWPKGGAS